MADNNTPTSSSVKSPDGKMTLDDKMIFEPQRLSYESADRIAQEICVEIANEIKDKTVVIVDMSLLADFAPALADAVRFHRSGTVSLIHEQGRPPDPSRGSK